MSDRRNFRRKVLFLMECTAYVFILISEFMDYPGGKESTCKAADVSMGTILGLGRFPEKEMATHSSILAWRIPRTEVPGRLLSMESKELYTA